MALLATRIQPYDEDKISPCQQDTDEVEITETDYIVGTATF